VTVRALLRHRSGLPDYFGMSQFFRDMLSDRSRAFTPDELLSYIAPYRPGEPDQLFVYSNTNYILLGQLIEHLDATDLNTALRNRISGRLGLDATQFALAGDPAINGLAGAWYSGIGNGDPATDYDSIASGAWAAGALVSTADELHTFLAALVAGDLISDGALTEMTAIDSDGVGLGLFAIVFASNRVGYGNTGEIYGYVSVMAIEHRTGDTLVILTNNDELDTFELANQILANW
jgi:D-alanyl-D-alanine carboxypeptidase